jgi:hypothetical protein
MVLVVADILGGWVEGVAIGPEVEQDADLGLGAAAGGDAGRCARMDALDDILGARWSRRPWPTLGLGTEALGARWSRRPWLTLGLGAAARGDVGRWA